ncbi:SRPBCC family protein [Nitratireductor sp. XY-223]|uniref:SRPBCC family protein n=1 Tax=Nitratireductor sp. XY-223 TaxID=2561926 RepID=UPI0010AB4AF2|nr:SRPBCC family protein [Nitratireductor sp. XY-223]
MIHHERTLELEATPDAVWAVIGRFMHIDDFAPQVKSVDALTEGEDGMGSKRRCHFDNGNSLVEEVIRWEPNRGYRVRLSEMEPMPLHEALAELSVEPVGNDRSKVTWSMDYRVKFGPVGWLLGQTMMKSMMGKVLDGNLKGLADKVRSNQAATGEAA